MNIKQIKQLHKRLKDFEKELKNDFTVDLGGPPENKKYKWKDNDLAALYSSLNETTYRMQLYLTKIEKK